MDSETTFKWVLSTIAQNNNLVSLEWALSLFSTSLEQKAESCLGRDREEWSPRSASPEANWRPVFLPEHLFVSLMTYQKISSNDIRLSVPKGLLLAFQWCITNHWWFSDPKGEHHKALNAILMWKVILCLEATDTLPSQALLRLRLHH